MLPSFTPPLRGIDFMSDMLGPQRRRRRLLLACVGAGMACGVAGSSLLVPLARASSGTVLQQARMTLAEYAELGRQLRGLQQAERSSAAQARSWRRLQGLLDVLAQTTQHGVMVQRMHWRPDRARLECVARKWCEVGAWRRRLLAVLPEADVSIEAWRRNGASGQARFSARIAFADRTPAHAEYLSRESLP